MAGNGSSKSCWWIHEGLCPRILVRLTLQASFPMAEGHDPKSLCMARWNVV